MKTKIATLILMTVPSFCFAQGSPTSLTCKEADDLIARLMTPVSERIQQAQQLSETQVPEKMQPSQQGTGEDQYRVPQQVTQVLQQLRQQIQQMCQQKEQQSQQQRSSADY